MRGRVDRDVDAARRNGNEIEPDVEKWLKNGVTEEAWKFLDDEDRAKKRCFNGLCPNLKSRYQLSKKAKKTTQEVVRIQGTGKFDRVSYPDPPQGIGSTSIKDFEAFESRMSTSKEILEALINPNINVIGVYGMGGVGKTTLVKKVAKRSKDDKLFDEVVMAEVSESPELKEIRGTIADMLGLKFDQASESGRADRLRERLKKEKRILVILDNIWGKLNLEEVGIPIGDDHKGCKILLTSRSQDVLSNQMDTQKNFGIQVLLEEEAWNLFKKMAGDSIEDPDLQPTAIEVAKKCARLPIAIVTIAKALRNKSLFVWKDALQQLQRSNPTNIMGMLADVYSSLELSYNHLESEEAKSLFLLCGLLVNYHIDITDLLKYGMGLGLFQDINTLEEARNRVHTLLHNLKASCLLLDSDIHGGVKMHDVVCDVAVSIASRDQNGLMMRYGVELKEWPKKDILKNCTAISLPYSNIHELPEWLECPELKLFLLYCKDPALKIPDTFFKEMKKLKVLDLSGIHFSSLPSSIHSLANLQTLCLDHCVLGDIAIIGEMKNLEILSFIGSDLVQLPREIRQLTNLRWLDLKKCTKLRVIPPNVISSLSRLEDLCMENSFSQWEVKGNASLVELKNLSCLIASEVHILDAKILPKGLLFENLIRYRILIGDVWDWSGDNETSRTLKLKLNTSIHLEDGVNTLLKKTEDLYLDELMGVKNLLYELDREGFRQLKHLHVQGNPEIQYIINSMEYVPCSAFPILESLVLNNLTNLKEICHAQLPVESFCKLRVIKVECCDKLKNIFSLSLARSLLQLQEMEINDCKIMYGIVGEGREDEEDNNEAMDKIMFPQLRYLTLQRLPELMSFCSKAKTMPSIPFRRQNLLTTDAGSREIISEGEHDIPIPLFDKKVAFPNLEDLVIKGISLKEIWHYQLPVGSFCKLKHLTVESCDLDLLNIIPSNMLMRLQNIESLRVSWSGGSLEYVFDLGGLNDKERHVVRATQLRYLELYNLPSLMLIWKKDAQGIFPFQKLSSLAVGFCLRLRNIFTTSIAKSLVQLQELSIMHCDMVEEIIEKEGVEEEAMDKIVFPQVTSLTLQFLPQLKSFCQGIHILEWPSLKKMEVSFCGHVEIFASELISFEETRGKGHLGIPTKQPLFLVDKVAFPNLEELELRSLFSMKEIWQGQFHAQSFCTLRVLKVLACSKILKVFPISLLQSLQNLEELSVDLCSSLEEVFEHGGVAGEVGHAATLPQLRELRLNELPKLMHMWKDSQLCQGLQNLATLEVRSCKSLTHLLPFAIAKSLVQIKSICVRNCKMMKEIIDYEEGEATDETTFSQLNSLELKHLPNFTSFCSGSSTFSFPSLEKVLVKGCPQLKTFSNGILSTPKLEKVQVQEDEWLWKGDLKTTIQHLFVQK